VIHPIPHQYCYVDTAFTHKTPCGCVPVVWLSLHSVPGRMFGATVLFESGALYRDVPLQALRHRLEASPWRPDEAQHWNSYGHQLQVLRLPYLDGLQMRVKCGRAQTHEQHGVYVFSIQPLEDDYSRAVDQDKTFTLVALENGRYTCQPTDRVLVYDASFTTHCGEWPTGLKRATHSYSCEHTEKIGCARCTNDRRMRKGRR
jgi:hypothetical protein